MATYNDLARHTGLSLATISKYFNGRPIRDENRAAIDAAVAELGYRINPAARSLRKGRSHCVGVLLPALDNLFHMTVVAELERSLRRANVGLLVSVSREDDPGQAVDFLLSRGADAIIAVPSPSDADALLQAARQGVALVTVDWLLDDPTIATVTLDNRGAGAMAAQHLLDRGHTRVAVVGGPDAITSLRDRALGFLERIERRGVELMPDAVAKAPPTIPGGASATSRLLFADERPTAIFAANYELTLGALTAIADSGLEVGRDVSLIGFDCAELAGLFRPRLTTITQPIAALATAAAERMLAKLDGTDEDEAPIRLSADLAVGDSVAQLG